MEDYKFDPMDPMLQKLIDEQMRNQGGMQVPPSYAPPAQQSPNFNMPNLEVGNMEMPDNRSENERLYASLQEKLKNRGVDQEIYQADRKLAGEEAGPSGMQQGLGMFATAMQGMATGGKDLSSAGKIKKSWDSDRKRAMDSVVDPSKGLNQQLDDMIRMKAMERADKAPGEKLALEDRKLDRADKRLQEQRSYDERQANKERGYKKDVREDEYAIKEKARLAKPTEGTKTMDREFAKDYNDWNSTGKSALNKNMDKLKRSRKLLADSKDDMWGTSGRFEGAMPDMLRSEQSKNIREDVHAAVQGALRATLGAQFTEKEGERIMKASYNENLSPEANLDRIDDAIRELESNAKTMDSRASYFRDNNSLKGWTPSSIVSAPKQMTPKQVRHNGKLYNVDANGDMTPAE